MALGIISTNLCQCQCAVSRVIKQIIFQSQKKTTIGNFIFSCMVNSTDIPIHIRDCIIMKKHKKTDIMCLYFPVQTKIPEP